jgi:hypothetical protein
VNVERLLNMLRALDPAKGDNLADDEEIQVRCVAVLFCFRFGREERGGF